MFSFAPHGYLVSFEIALRNLLHFMCILAAKCISCQNKQRVFVNGLNGPQIIFVRFHYTNRVTRRRDGTSTEASFPQDIIRSVHVFP